MSDRRPHFYFEIFAAALAAILLEIAYTRVFSFKVFYYFTYLIIGLGLLGIGAGGVFVAISQRLRAIEPARLIPLLCLVGGASVYPGYCIIAPTQLNAMDLAGDPLEIAKLIGVCLVLVVPFLSVGLVISTILGSRPERVGRLYATDLVAAGAGCMFVIPLLEALDPPGTIALSGCLLALGGLRLAAPPAWLRPAGAALCLVLLAPVLTPRLLPDVVVDESKLLEAFKEAGLVVFSQWNPVFRVDVAAVPGDAENTFLLHHDGQRGSGMRRFDGDFERFQYLNTDPRSLPFQVAPKRPKVLIIGSAAGHEVIASLFFGASEITGVELNPVTLSLLTDHFAELSGNLHEHPQVTLVNGDGRWFLNQTDERYDIIWFVAPDSYAAMNAATAGAFVLSESYLYTVETIRESLSRLTDDGIICAHFGDLTLLRNRTTRYLSTAREAFALEGMTDFGAHALVGHSWEWFRHFVVLLGKQPFTAEEVRSFAGQASGLDQGGVLWAPGVRQNASSIHRAIQLAGEERALWLRDHSHRVDPVRDDSPFFWHFTRYRDAIAGAFEPDIMGIALGERVTLVFLGVATTLAAVFLLLPFVFVRRIFREIPNKANALLYFAALGLGFMFIEVAMIQKLTLFLGYPTYSLSVTLFGILVFSGIGSLISGRFTAMRNRALLLILIALAASLALYDLALPALIQTAIGSPLPFRVAAAILLIAPVGLCLGSFMPIGLGSIAAASSYPREYVAWAWAINGFFSVIASILATILGMVFGFQLLLVIALAIYVVGACALAWTPTRRGVASA